VNDTYRGYLEVFGGQSAYIDNIVPQVIERGIAEICNAVAITGIPHKETGFRLVNGSDETYWDWSVSRLPTAAGDEVCLLVQANKVSRPVLCAAG
jgi:hypothetical protein